VFLAFYLYLEDRDSSFHDTTSSTHYVHRRRPPTKNDGPRKPPLMRGTVTSREKKVPFAEHKQLIYSNTISRADSDARWNQKDPRGRD
jgi:hypothetical protein